MSRHKHRQILTLIKHLLLPAGKRERCYCYDFVNYLGGVRHCGEEQQYNQNLERHPGIDSQREHWITAAARWTLNPHVCCLELHFQALIYHKCSSTGETTQFTKLDRFCENFREIFLSKPYCFPKYGVRATGLICTMSGTYQRVQQNG